MAMEVDKPNLKFTENEAPMVKPSVKLCNASPNKISVATGLACDKLLTKVVLCFLTTDSVSCCSSGSMSVMGVMGKAHDPECE